MNTHLTCLPAGGRLLAVAAAVTLVGAGPAAGQGSRPARSVVVHVADLDLTTAKGVRKLNARIERAAYQLCDPDGPAYVRPWHAVRRCAWRVVHAQREKVRLAVAEAHDRKRRVAAAAAEPAIG